jgi:UDP:flavonoid glycosyltransferase YjiC (YdhE family)
MEAVYHGVPMLMLSSGYTELASYAQMFHSRGLGIQLKQADASPENVANCAARMRSDPALRTGLQKIQRALRQSAGAEELANWLGERVSQR